MALQVIGAGVGRTGTASLWLALGQLGLGPCHHMAEVFQNLPVQVPLWLAALDRHADWGAIYEGYESAVDWPTAGFFRELNAVYPSAKIILTVRSPESWAESFSETIYKVLSESGKVPPAMKPWFDMVSGVIRKTGFPLGLNFAGLVNVFNAHTDAVKAAIPSDRLLIYEVKDGWGPLCTFLGKPVPAEPFPRTNSRADFWERVGTAMAGG
jgi:Sulfotransferase domain